MEDAETSQSASLADAIKENPLLFAALLVVFCIVVFLAALAIYLLGVQTGTEANLPPLSTTTIQFATSTPTDATDSTPIPAPGGASIDMLSVQGNSGTLVTITGQNWTPGDALVVRIDGPAWSQTVQSLFANVQAADNGAFIASFILPINTGCDDLATIQITVESSATGEHASAEFSIVSPTPTVAPSSAGTGTATRGKVSPASSNATPATAG